MTQRAEYHHGDLANALVEHTYDVVRDGGAEAFSMRGAARAIGVDPAAAYKHFDGKKGLMAAVASRVFSELAVAMEERMQDATEPRERFASTGLAYVAFAARAPHLFRVAFGPMGAGGQQREHVRGVGERGLDPYELLVESLDALLEHGALVVEIEHAATASWAAVHGVAHLAIEQEWDEAQAVDAAQVVIEMVLRGICVGAR